MEKNPGFFSLTHIRQVALVMGKAEVGGWMWYFGWGGGGNKEMKRLKPLFAFNLPRQLFSFVLILFGENGWLFITRCS